MDQLYPAFLESIHKAGSNLNIMHQNSVRPSQHLSGVPLNGQQSLADSTDMHQYQNLVLSSDEPGPAHPSDSTRPHSSMATADSSSHNYFNSSGNNGLGVKTQPNYYTSNPISYHGSKNSLNGSVHYVSRFGSYDSNTLPQAKSIRSNHHEYVNSGHFDADINPTELSHQNPTSSQTGDVHPLYENHDLPLLSKRKLHTKRSQMRDDDLATFCCVNIDSESKSKDTINQGNHNEHNFVQLFNLLLLL